MATSYGTKMKRANVKYLRKLPLYFSVLRSHGLFRSTGDYLKFLRCLLSRHPHKEPVYIAVKKFEHVLACRPGTADAAMLWHSLIAEMHIANIPLPEDATIFDLGANAGYTIIDFAQQFPTAKIWAVELDPQNAAIARQNFAPFADRCTLIEGAVWHEDGEIDYGGGGTEALRVNGTPTAPADRKARSFTINTLMEMNGVEHIDLLKIDIEGAEAKVLDSDAAWMKKVDIINLEAHFDHISSEECQQRLEAAGFDVEIGKDDPKWLWGQRIVV